MPGRGNKKSGNMPGRHSKHEDVGRHSAGSHDARSRHATPDRRAGNNAAAPAPQHRQAQATRAGGAAPSARGAAAQVPAAKDGAGARPRTPAHIGQSESDLSARLDRLQATGSLKRAPQSATRASQQPQRAQSASQASPETTGSLVPGLQDYAGTGEQPLYRRKPLPKTDAVKRNDYLDPDAPLPGPGAQTRRDRKKAERYRRKHPSGTHDAGRARGAHGAHDMLGEEAAANHARARKRSRRRAVIAIVVALLVVAGCFVGWRYLGGLRDASNQLDQALALIEQSDTNMVAVDDAVNSQVDADSVDQLPNLISSTYATEETLGQANESAVIARNAKWAEGDERSDVAQQACEDIAARKDMLAAARTIMQADYDAYKASDALSQAWTLITQADEAARASAQQASAATTDNMADELPAAIEQANAAKTSLSQANTLITQASTSMPTADFGAIISYITAKSTALDRQIDADNAMLTGTAEEREAAVQAFNEADAAAVEAAQALPNDVSTTITTAYLQLTNDAVESYSAARARVAKADVSIRDYLGVNDIAFSDSAQGASDADSDSAAGADGDGQDGAADAASDV